MSDKEHESIGQRVRRLRMEAGLSAYALERLSKVSNKTMWGLENDRHMPRVDTAIQIAAALGVSLDYLCCLTDMLPENWKPPKHPDPKKEARAEKKRAAARLRYRLMKEAEERQKEAEAEREHKERVREELARPAFRDPMTAALYGEVA